jgi:hypothetical protein
LREHEIALENEKKLSHQQLEQLHRQEQMEKQRLKDQQIFHENQHSKWNIRFTIVKSLSMTEPAYPSAIELQTAVAHSLSSAVSNGTLALELNQNCFLCFISAGECAWMYRHLLLCNFYFFLLLLVLALGFIM